jgi:hypothetical protein
LFDKSEISSPDVSINFLRDFARRSLWLRKRKLKKTRKTRRVTRSRKPSQKEKPQSMELGFLQGRKSFDWLWYSTGKAEAVSTEIPTKN